MARLVRKTVILAKIETTSGTDATPVGATDALQVQNMSITPLDAKNIDTNIINPWFGSSAQLVGSASVKCSFSVLLSGSGTAATAPAWDALMRACANSATTTTFVLYKPCTDSLETVTIYYEDDGVRHKLLGCFGNVKLSAKSGEAPMLTFDFVGIDGGATATANDSATLTAWKLPVAVTKANVTDVMLGCTVTSGVPSGGTSYNTNGLTLDWGNKVAFAPMLTNERVVLTDRAVVGTISMELSAAQEVAQITSVKANTTIALGFVLGSAVGYKVALFLPKVQFLNPKKEDFNGMRLIGFDLRVVPSAGNDEVQLATM